MFKIILLLSTLIFVTYSQIRIKTPRNLEIQFYQGQVNFAIANFGFVPYGKIVKGIVKQGKNPQGGLISDACSPLKTLEKSEKKGAFILVERKPQTGDCTIVNQAENAQRAGYSMVIVKDYADEDLEYLDIEDDLHHSQLKIPVIIVKKSDGDKFQDYFYLNEKIKVEIFFNPPYKRQIIDITFWMDTMDWQSYMFILNVKDLMEKLEHKANFVPRFPLYSDAKAEQNGFAYPHPDCLGNGRYCSVDPDGLEGTYNQQGKDATREKLRSKCVYQNGVTEQWFRYQVRFATLCMKLKGKQLEDCSMDIVRKVGISPDSVQKCYSNSFYYDEDTINYNSGYSEEDMKNYYLESELEDWNNSNALVWPALIVNGLPFRGDLNNESATFEFICQGFVDEPDVCKSWDNWDFGEPIPTLESYKLHFIENIVFYSIGAVFIAIFLFITYRCYRQRVKQDVQKELALQVNSSMSQYFALNDKTSGKKDTGSIDTDI